MNPVLLRCHMLSDIMTEPKDKKETLSVGAKTAIKKLAKEAIYGASVRVDNKYTKKGLQCEQTSIDLLNDVVGMPFTKNTMRLKNDWITGEPDIVADNFGVDIKTSWSIDTFPMLPEDGQEKAYEWQCRGYMMLFDKPSWTVAYCLVDTPEALIGFEDPKLHQVSHIDPRMRVTLVSYERDETLEMAIRAKCEAAQLYYQHLLDVVLNKRGIKQVFVSAPPTENLRAKLAFANT